LRYSSLPYAYADSAKGSDHQGSRKPRQPLIGLDLRSCELMLLILASLSGCLYWVWRCIKNERIPLTMEWLVYAILFLIGQGGVYLLCMRMEGL
jgi:hypothetical protein